MKNYFSNLKINRIIYLIMMHDKNKSRFQSISGLRDLLKKKKQKLNSPDICVYRSMSVE